ncbi:MAG: class I SAM-dependent methyltransferase, partial [bacterium]
MSINTEQIQSLKNMFAVGYESAVHKFGKYFPSYFPDMFAGENHVNRYIKRFSHYFTLINAYGQQIADCGCGYGTVPILFCMFGARTVWGVESRKVMIDAFSKCINEISPQLTGIYPLRSDAEQLPFKSASIDVITSFDSISHMRNPERLFHEAQRVLRPGGRMLIVDGNSSLDMSHFYRHYAVWKHFEYSYKKVVHDENPEPYSLQRKNIIQNYAPNLSIKDTNKLTKITRGLWQPEIIQAVNEFKQSGS